MTTYVAYLTACQHVLTQNMNLSIMTIDRLPVVNRSQQQATDSPGLSARQSWVDFFKKGVIWKM
jgi:hypothetical protein